MTHLGDSAPLSSRLWGEAPSAGVWGVPSFSFSSLAAAGGKESLKSAPMGVSPCLSLFPKEVGWLYTLWEFL